jgi:UDP-glucose 4-epimerase
MTRVLITGASGFIGSYLVQHLTGFEIKTLSLKHPNWIDQSFASDVIIHCAGLAHATKSIPEQTYHQVNCELTKQLVNKAMQDQVKQFIYLSTALVFGEGHVGAITMDSPLQPVSAYAKSKVCAEQVVDAAKELKSLILRIPLVLGDAPKGNLKSLAKLARISPIFIDVQNRRSVLTLTDLTTIIQEAIQNQQEGVLHPKSYDCSTSELYTNYRTHTWMIPIPRWLMKTARMRSRFFAKLFGDFYYQLVGDTHEA